MPTNGAGITRNADAGIVIPTENEWYKAAYYNPANQTYWEFPTASNVKPTADPVPGGPDSANFIPGGWPNPDYADSLGHLTNVGAFTSAVSSYGTYDQGGDSLQWNESLIGTNRGIRGGQYGYVWDHMASFYRDWGPPDYGWYAGVTLRMVDLRQPASATSQLPERVVFRNVQ